ncbi:MAG: hypothetical protein J6G98_02545 [Bacilli bacterium]|nr:hypothetical protein [Bacilli bacterium]
MDIKQRLKDYRFYSKKNNMDRAGIIINELLDIYPNDPYVLFEYSIYLSKIGGAKEKKESLLILKELIDNNAVNKFDCCYEFVRGSVFTKYYIEYVEEYANLIIENHYMEMQTEYYLGRFYELRGLKNMSIEHYKKSSDLGFEKSKKRLKDFENMSNLTNKEVLNAISISENNCLFELENRTSLLRRQAKYNEIRVLLRNFEDKYTTFYKKTTVNYLFNAYYSIGYFNDAIRVYENSKKNLSEDFKMYIDAKIDLINNNYNEAESKFNKLIRKNSEYKPNSYFYLAELANIAKNYELEEFYYNCICDFNDFRDDAYLKKLTLYIRQNKKNKALKVLNKISKSYIRVHQPIFSQINALLGLKLFEYENDYYTVKQIKNYDYNLTVDHIKRHTNESDYYSSKINFNDDIRIEELIPDVCLRINQDTLKYCDLFEHYIIQYNSCGSFDDIEANYIEAIIIPNTKKIITMYPVVSDNMFSAKRMDKEPKKIKRKSQIDKFNERYNKNL